MAQEDDRARLAALGRLAECKSELGRLERELAGAPHWRPAAGLAVQVREVARLLEELRERLQRKLVVTLIGPSGSGKSTLINALAGTDGLSETGHARPTTRQVVALCRDKADAELFLSRFAPGAAVAKSSPAAAALEHVMLVDTPDTDSNLLPQHRPMVEQAIAHSDVLLCVFHAENPKRRDNIDFLEPFVRLFPGELLFAVINHSDRQNEQELRGEITPDFQRHLTQAWGRPAELFCISARRHLQNPQWPAGEAPEHAFDQYGELRELIFGSINQAGQVVDARVRRAEHLMKLIGGMIEERTAPIRPRLEEARVALAQLENKARHAAVESLRVSSAEFGFGLTALVYQRLAEEWWGPTGWLVGLWARLSLVGTGLVGLFRLGHPVQQAVGAVSSALRLRRSRRAIQQLTEGQGIGAALQECRLALEKGWPDLAEKLIEAGFDGAVRDAGAALAGDDSRQEAIAAAWRGEFDAAVNRVARRASRLPLQLVFNLPAIALIGIIGYQCVKNFVFGTYLSADYFRHALLTLLIVWIVPFILLQLLVRALSGRRLIARALGNVMKAMESRTGELAENPIAKEIEAVARLAASTRQ